MDTRRNILSSPVTNEFIKRYGFQKDGLSTQALEVRLDCFSHKERHKVKVLGLRDSQSIRKSIFGNFELLDVYFVYFYKKRLSLDPHSSS